MGLIKSIKTQDYELSKVQDNLVNAINRLPADSPIIEGQFVTATLGTADSAVQHKLSRAVKGWIVVRKNAQGDVWESTAANLRPNDQIIMKASASVAVTIYFF